jgi:hypothetical protein
VSDETLLGRGGVLRLTKSLTLPRLDLDQPQDHVGVVLAGPAHGPHAVDDGRLDLDEAFAALALHGPPSRALRQRRSDGVIGALGEDEANHLRMRLDPGQAVISGLKPSVSVLKKPTLSHNDRSRVRQRRALLQFPSIVAAVECPVLMPKMMTERNAALPEAKRILYWIGVNLGDVLIEGDELGGGPCP